MEAGGSDPAPTAVGGAKGEVLPLLTAGVPASAPPAAGGQLGAGAPAAPAVPLLFADTLGAEHELDGFSPDEFTVGPLPVGAVLMGGGVVVVEGGGGEVAGSEVDAAPVPEAVPGSEAAPASEPVPAEQSVDPAAVPPAVESLAPA